MSLITNRQNIYIINPINRYADDMVKWSDFMENDFTIYLRSKVLLDEMKRGERNFMFSRNGKHAGISTYKDDSDNLHISFTYWFWQTPIKTGADGSIYYDNPIPIQKTITYCCLPEEKFKYNDYIVKCNHKEKIMQLYVNDILVGEIDYSGLDKCSYKEAYVWFGCGNMVTDDEDHKNIGAYEFDLFFCLNENISLEDIADLKNNYKSKYIKTYLDMEILNEDTPFKDNMFFFLNFEKKTQYKLWNLAFNGHYPNFYIENNTIF
jgi:hypothetical protein